MEYVTIFDIASIHARKSAWWAAMVIFSVLYAGDALMGELPGKAVVIGYFFVAMAVWGVAAAATYYGYLLYAGAFPVPDISFQVFNVTMDDSGQPPEPSASVPEGQPVRARPTPRLADEAKATPAPAPGDHNPVRMQAALRASGVVQALGVVQGGPIGSVDFDGVLDKYPEVTSKLIPFLSDRFNTMISGRTLHDGGVVTRDNRVTPNATMFICALEEKGYLNHINNQQYVLTDKGELWVAQQGG